jgi:hypothetical protein
LTKSVKFSTILPWLCQKEATISTPQILPDSKKSATAHVLVDGRYELLTLGVDWIVPHEVYAVALEDTAHRIGVGEIHATTLDGDSIPESPADSGLHFPSRYRKGLYSIRRACWHKLVDLDHFDTAKPGNFERRPEVLAARRDKLQRWADALTRVINGHLNLIEQVKGWAENAKRTGDQAGAFSLVQQLDQLHARPYYGMCRRLMNHLHGGGLDQILAYCEIIAERDRLEGVMSPVSDVVERVERHKDDPGVTIGRICSAEARSAHAATLRQTIEALMRTGPVVDKNFNRAIGLFEVTCEELEHGTIKNTKVILQNAVTELDTMLRL